MLDHALKIHASDVYQSMITAMVPSLKAEDRRRLLNLYQRQILGDDEKSDAIIKQDRESLRKLLSGKHGRIIKQSR